MSLEYLGENKILTRDGVVELVDENYMCFRVHEHIRKPDKDRTSEIIAAYHDLSKGKKHPLLLVAPQIDRVGEEEKKIIRETTIKYFTKQAIVTQSKFTVVVVNMLKVISPPPVPTKLFSEEKEALEWLFEKN